MGVRKYTQEVVKEGKRVRWPKAEVFIPALVATIVICTVCALILSLEDFAAGSLIAQLKNVFKGIASSSSEVADAAARLLK